MGGRSPAFAKAFCKALALMPVARATSAVVHTVSGWLRIKSIACLTTACDAGLPSPFSASM
jgi:hypothetical protein